MKIRFCFLALILTVLVAQAAVAQTPRPAPEAPTPAAKAAPASDIDGEWLGTIDTGAIQLRVAFHIRSTAQGLAATMDSLDQGAKGIPVASVTRKGSSLTIDMPQIRGAYKGEIAANLESIDGNWTQAGTSFPLLLKRVKDAAQLELRRPQVPAKPYPYREEEVAFDNRAANVRLAGTLTVPAGKGPFPAALLITGSGPQDRDESLMGHKPFLVLADYLTRKGIAVLRVDDRGIGKSTGSFTGATTADFATDAEAAVAYLQSRAEVDPRRIGLVGHSEGGMIAPMIAARNRSIAFLVLMAGTGVPGDEVLVEQVRMIAAAGGAMPEQVTDATARQREVLTLIKTVKDDAERDRRLREELAGSMPEAQLNAQMKAISTPWFRYFLAYDPAVALRRVSCPVLAINGEKDTQVSPRQNLPAIRAALAAAHNSEVEVVELPGLNHLFQTAKTGAPSEYGRIEETMSPVALDKIASWILAHTSSAPAVPARP